MQGKTVHRSRSQIVDTVFVRVVELGELLREKLYRQVLKLQRDSRYFMFRRQS
jgi:hypothetical protein